MRDSSEKNPDNASVFDLYRPSIGEIAFSIDIDIVVVFFLKLQI